MDLSSTVTGVDVVYVASDDILGITKYSLGGSWTANGTVGAAADAYRGLTCLFNGSDVALYATRKGTEFISLADGSGYNGAFSGTPTLLATAATNTAFRGVDFTPGTSTTAVTLRTLTARAPLTPLAALPAAALALAGGAFVWRHRREA